MKKITTFAITVALTAMGFGPFAAKVEAFESHDYACVVSNGLAGGLFQASNHGDAIGYCQWSVNQAAIAACSGQPDGDPFTLGYFSVYFPEGFEGYNNYYLHGGSQTYRCENGWAAIV